MPAEGSVPRLRRAPPRSAEIKRHVGYMTQRFSLLRGPDASEENLDFIARVYGGARSRREPVQRQRSNACASLNRSTPARGFELSGGWKQRLALAACLHPRTPQLLLLDEPTAGVDPKARRDFWERDSRSSPPTASRCSSARTTWTRPSAATSLAYISYGQAAGHRHGLRGHRAVGLAAPGRDAAAPALSAVHEAALLPNVPSPGWWCPFRRRCCM